MATVVCVLDRDDWQANTDNIVVADPVRRLLTWVPRDLWCPALGDRVNAAFAQGGHERLRAALAELGLRVSHSLCLRRRAAEKALAGLSVTVPVPVPLDMLYPLAPRIPIQKGHKLVQFRPPAERLEGERVHQWIGGRRLLRGPSGDLARIHRQQVLVRRLLETGFDFAAALAEAGDHRLSSPAALGELGAVRSGWRFAVLDAVRPALIAGKEVLLRKRGLERWLAVSGPGRLVAAFARTLRDWLLGSVLAVPAFGLRPPRRRVRLLAVLAARDEESYLPGFLANVAPHVDGIVALDDGSRDNTARLLREHPAVLEVLDVPADRPAWDEVGNFRRLQAAALRHGAQWIVSLDADERVERRFRDRAERVIRRCRRLGLGAVTVRLRELWGTAASYRCDGPWGRKRVPRLFAARADHRFDLRPLHAVKAPLQARVLGGFVAADLEVYHLRTLDREEREARRDRYLALDPETRWQPGLGYEYLTDERGLRLRRVPARRRFLEDGHHPARAAAAGGPAMPGAGGQAPLRVLVLANYFDRDGGTSKTLTECKYLSALGVRPVVVVPSNPFARADVRAQLRALGIRYYSAPTHFRVTRFFLLYSAWRIGRIVRDERIDLLHANHGRTLLLGAILSRRHRVPLVYTIHGVSRRELPQVMADRLFRRVARVLAVSQETAAHFLGRVRYPAERVAIMGNPIDFPRFARDGAGRDGGVLYLSRLDRDRRRATAAVLDAAARLAGEQPRFSLRILGAGRDSARVRRRARAINSAVGRRAIMVEGWADDPAERIARAGAVLGAGRCVLEAIAAGRPVLVVGSERIGGWVTAENFRDLQRANFSGRGAGPATSGENLAAELGPAWAGATLDARVRLLAAADHDAAPLAATLRDLYLGLLPVRAGDESQSSAS